MSKLKARATVIPDQFDKLKVFLLQIQAMTEKRIPIKVFRCTLNSHENQHPTETVEVKQVLKYSPEVGQWVLTCQSFIVFFDTILTPQCCGHINISQNY